MYFQCGTRTIARTLAKYGTKVYRYAFTHKPSSGIQRIGVYHAAELPFVFETTPGGGMFPSEFNDDEYQLARIISSQWVAFAKSGVPDSRWPLYSTTTDPTFILNTSLLADSPVIESFKQVCESDITSLCERPRVILVLMSILVGGKLECDFWDVLFEKGLPRRHVDYFEKEPLRSRILNVYLLRILKDRWLLRGIAGAMFVVISLVAYWLAGRFCGKGASPPADATANKTKSKTPSSSSSSTTSTKSGSTPKTKATKVE